MYVCTFCVCVFSGPDRTAQEGVLLEHLQCTAGRQCVWIDAARANCCLFSLTLCASDTGIRTQRSPGSNLSSIWQEQCAFSMSHTLPWMHILSKDSDPFKRTERGRELVNWYLMGTLHAPDMQLEMLVESVDHQCSCKIRSHHTKSFTETTMDLFLRLHELSCSFQCNDCGCR